MSSPSYHLYVQTADTVKPLKWRNMKRAQLKQQLERYDSGTCSLRIVAAERKTCQVSWQNGADLDTVLAELERAVKAVPIYISCSQQEMSLPCVNARKYHLYVQPPTEGAKTLKWRNMNRNALKNMLDQYEAYPGFSLRIVAAENRTCQVPWQSGADLDKVLAQLDNTC